MHPWSRPEQVRALGRTLPRSSEHLAREDEMTERVRDAWAMVVPQFLARERLGR